MIAMTDAELLTGAEIDYMERRCAALLEDGRWDHAWTTHSVMCALATIRDLQDNLADQDARVVDAAAQIEALRAEAERQQQALKAARDALVWVTSWTSNPVSSFSVMALDGFFQIAREKTDEALAKIDGLTRES